MSARRAALGAALTAAALTGAAGAAGAQQPAPSDSAAEPAATSAQGARWYDRVALRGYAQVRYNRLLESNPRLVCTQCDRSMGNNGGIFLRRARVSVVAQVSDRVSAVFQPDFTAEAGEASGIAQVRDAYAEVALDRHRAMRVRLGQTNVPYGFENIVSSSKRLPFDRADALNSAVPTERDMGMFVLWTPRAARERYRALERAADKGTGDYGAVTVAVYDGQTANRPEQNNNLHSALRLAYPFAVGGAQVVEAVVHGYTGRFVVTTAQRTAGTSAPREFADQRLGAALVLHPAPLGLQAEWTIGVGPEADAVARTIRERHLQGGYVQASLRTRALGRTLTPYVRAQRYDGGKKFELDARRHRVREIEGGVELPAGAGVELTAAFMAATRETSDLANPRNAQRGQRVRVQAQFSF